MPNYNNGKIYKVINPQNEIIYIGSTAQEQLCDRFKTHKHRGNGNKIILLENYPCNCKQELIKREQELIEQFDNLLNINRAYIPEEYNKEYNKEYHFNYWKEYYEENKNELLEYQKEYRKENKNKILERAKVYYENNKNKISEKIFCECGCQLRKDKILRHKKSKKHIKLMESK